MALDKNDFRKIEKLFEGSERRITEKLTKKIESSKSEILTTVDKKIESSKNEIIGILSREITDLAEINQDVIQRVDKIAELEKRIIRLETIVLKAR